ncbi:MAG: Crp/Fnr family transcriptional regulator [Clostridiaceae bacterium]|nr:Crp/Fnr family transcriptional regulator [Clostridiaceae bacterium]
MTDRWKSVLMDTRLFAGLSSEQLDVLLACFRAIERSFAKGDLLCLAGQPQTTVGLILDGRVLVQQEDEAGSRLIIGLFGAGDLFGEVAAFAGNGVWPNTVVADSGGAVLFIPFEKISRPCCRACDAHQVMAANMLGILAGKAMLMNKRIGYIRLKGMRQKLAAFLYDQYRQNGSCTFRTQMNREALADYLNVSRPSMSRELSRMKTDRLIDYYRSSFTVIDPKRLVALIQAEN